MSYLLMVLICAVSGLWQESISCPSYRAKEMTVFRATQVSVLDMSVANMAERFELDPFLLKGLLTNESRMNPKMRSSGGRGISSFTPSGVDAVNEMRRRTNSPEPRFLWCQTMNAELAILATAELLAHYTQVYGRDGSICAYNGGGQHGRYVRRYGYWVAKRKGLLARSGGVRLSGKYLENVLRQANLLRAAAGLPPLDPPGPRRVATN